MNDVVRRYMVMPTTSLVMVTKGPALIAGSMLAFIKRMGAVDPIVAATLTENTMPNPTAIPKRGDV